MKKIAKRLLIYGLTFTMLLPTVACDNSNSKEASTKKSFGEVWSAPTTEKILLEQTDFGNKGAAELSYQMVRNEYESYQLFITAEKDIEAFSLKTTDLKNGNATLSAENIDVYLQKYVYFNDTSGEGNIPDPLIPMDAAAEYEENTIKAGQNGGLWITVYVPKEVEAGLYEGVFELTVNSAGKKSVMDIPVSVEVFEYTLTDEVNAKTLFSWRHHQVAAGELDGSNEMMTAYYEFCLDYRISPQAFPLEVLSAEEYMEDVLNYYDEFSTYTLHCYVGHISGELDKYPEYVEEQILAIAAACTSERNLFDKTMMYFIDEPHLYEAATREKVVSRSNVMKGYLQDCVDKIKADTTGIYDGLKAISNWEQSITEIPRIIPIGRQSFEWLMKNEHTVEGQEALAALNCVCPIFTSFTDVMRDKIVNLTKKYNIDLWWYGCVSSLEPVPTYFIGDENLLSSRTVSWLQKKYNIQGNLYWDIAGYTWDQANSGAEYNTALYEWPDRDGSGGLQAGDGNLVYPGAAYGVYGPLPSLRLMSIRDGMEEYELLLDIEETYMKMGADFGKGFSVEDAMEHFYTTLAYDGIKMYKDGEETLNFVRLRGELLKFATNLKKGLAYAMGTVNVTNETAVFSLYAVDGTKIYIDGEEILPLEDQKYEYSMDVSKSSYVTITVKNTNGEQAIYNQFIAVPKYLLTALSDKSEIEHMTVTDGSSVNFATSDTYSTDGTSIRFNIEGQVTGNVLKDVSFVPQASISTTVFGDKQLSDFSSITMDVYNSKEAFVAAVRLYSGSTYLEFGEVSVPEGEITLEFKMNQIQNDKLSTVDRIAFEFQNSEDGTACSYEFYVDNIVGKK